MWRRKKTQERWNYLGVIIHKMLAKPNLDFVKSSLHSSLLLLTICYASAERDRPFSLLSSIFLCSFWTCAFLQDNVFSTYIFILNCSSMAAMDHWSHPTWREPALLRALSQLNLVWRKHLPSSQHVLKPHPLAQPTCSPSVRSFANELIMSWKPLIKRFLVLEVGRGCNNRVDL